MVAAPVALFVFWQGGVAFAAGMLFLALAAWNEYGQMMSNNSLRPPILLGGICVFAIVAVTWLYGLQHLSPLVLFILLIVLSHSVVNCQSFAIEEAAYSLLGILYCGIPFAYFIALRLSPDPNGLKFFALAMLGTWACDTTAYFGGTKWGKNKLRPTISPAKTVEGAFFGFAGSVAVSLLAGHYMQISWLDSFLCGSITGLFCQLGDLAESAVKRHMGVKDSGRFFPGHGGVLDRVDSLLFSVPAMYYYLIWFSGQ